MGRIFRLKELAAFLAASHNSQVYHGFLGYDNLGDEVLWDQVRAAFAPLSLVSAPPRSRGLRQKLVDRKTWDRVILGGGTLIGGNLRDGSNPFREHFEWFQSRARHSVVFGTGAGKLSDDPSENVWLSEWEPLLARADYIGVRGPMSVEALASIGIEAELLGDLACLMAQGPGFWAPPRTNVLGVNLGRVDPKSDRTEAEAATEQNLVEVLSDLVAERARGGWRTEFFVVVPADCAIVDQVVRRSSVTDCKIHRIYRDGHEYLNAVRHVTAFVGMKLHSVILAMCAGVPSIMVSYASKCDDFMMSVELDEYVVPLERLNLDVLNRKLETLMSSAAPLGRQITRSMNAYRKKQMDRAAILRSWHSPAAVAPLVGCPSRSSAGPLGVAQG